MFAERDARVPVQIKERSGPVFVRGSPFWPAVWSPAGTGWEGFEPQLLGISLSGRWRRTYAAVDHSLASLTDPVKNRSECNIISVIMIIFFLL